MRARGSLAEGPFFALGLAMLVVLALWLTRDHAVPIAIAVLIWFLITALAETLRRRLAGLVRLGPLSARILAGLLLAAVAGVAGNLISQGLTELAIDAANRQGALLERIGSLAAGLGVETLPDADRLIALIEPQRWLGDVVGLVQGLIQDLALTFLYVLFLLVDERFYAAKLRALFPDPERRAEIKTTLASIGETTRVYLWLMSLVSAGVALTTYAVCTGVGLGGAGLWAFLAFGLNFVPTIGSILAVVLPGLYALATLPDLGLLLLLVLLLAATHFVAGELVVPRVMGNRMNLSSFVILFVLVSWGAVWGPAGMFLAIPITVILLLIAARFAPTRPIAILLSKDGIVPEIVPRMATRPVDKGEPTG